MVVIRLLDILCEMTSDCKEFMALQDHSDLLSATVGKCGEMWRNAFVGDKNPNAFLMRIHKNHRT